MLRSLRLLRHFTKRKLILSVSSIVAGFAIFANLPHKMAEKATVGYLAGATLKTLGDDPKEFGAAELWRKSGAVIMVVRRPG